MGPERPPRRWHHAATDLRDFALVTWAVDPTRLAALLPREFTPDIRDGHGLVSMAAFQDEGFHFRCAPFARFSCGQVNYRAYVRRGDRRGVWFFGTTLDSALVALPRSVWKMPWRRARVRIAAEWDARGCRTWRLRAEGAWGGGELVLRGCGERAALLEGFADAEEMRRVLVDPFEGWYARRDDSGVDGYRVWHEPLQLEAATVETARCDVFSDLGLIGIGERPIHAGVQRRVRFDVLTPPRREPF